MSQSEHNRIAGSDRDQAGAGTKAPTVLLEMRPALEGFAGIPQETRLLFRGLRMLGSFEVEGMIQTSKRRLSPGTKPAGRFRWFTSDMSEARKINRYSRVVVSLADRPYRTLVDRIADFFERKLAATTLTARTLAGIGEIRLTRFQSQYFEDFIWRSMFSKTLPASDYSLITSANQRICAVPWHTMHMVGLKSLSVTSWARYPKVETKGIDVFIAQTPYPGNVTGKTNLVVRYHDAIPVFMPHTIPDKADHQATHFHALANNVAAGGWFACVSEATRQDLLRLFPEAAPRAVTIHNMVSHHYFREESARALVPGIIRSRLYEGDPGKQMFLKPKFLSLREQEGFYRKHLSEKPFRYLLMVSTIEPRKNHARLLAAWEVLKAEVDPDLKLVVVGALGWDYNSIFDAFRAWIDRGDLFALSAVPAPDLRVLYRHAVATVCPSLGEGFDFSGVEAMRSGGVVIASDIPVHREVYEDGAEYFDPYATSTLVRALKRVIYDDGAAGRQHELRLRGDSVSARYLPEQILPQWQAFLDRVVESGKLGQIVPAQPASLDREVVVTAFRELLDRVPESEAVIEAHRKHGSDPELRRVLRASNEFAERMARLSLVQREADAAIDRALSGMTVPQTGSELLASPVIDPEHQLRDSTGSAPLSARDHDEGPTPGLPRMPAVAEIAVSVRHETAGSDGIVAVLERPAQRDDVIAIFGALLGRAPESEETIAAHLQHSTPAAIEAVIKASPEFRARQTAQGQVTSQWVCTEVLGGQRIWVDLSDRYVSAGCLQDSWEPEESRYFRSCLKEGQTVLDIGANVGWYSLIAAQAVGQSGKVHAFEPRPDTARMLRRTIADNGLEGRIQVWELALDDRDGSERLGWEPASANPGHSFLVRQEGAAVADSVAMIGEVRAAMLDTLLPEIAPDVVKIDVEGAEPRVIAGAQRALGRRRPVILSELFPEQLERVSGTTASGFIALMEAFGYHCYLLEGGQPGRRLKDFPADARRELVSVVFVAATH